MRTVGTGPVTASSSVTVGIRGQFDSRCPKPCTVGMEPPAGREAMASATRDRASCAHRVAVVSILERRAASRSRWAWASHRPGMTKAPSASSLRSPRGSKSGPISVTTPSLTRMSMGSGGGCVRLRPSIGGLRVAARRRPSWWRVRKWTGRACCRRSEAMSDYGPADRSVSLLRTSHAYSCD